MRGRPAPDDARQPADRRPPRRPHAGRDGPRPVRVPAGAMDRGGDRGRAQRSAGRRTAGGAMKVTVNDEDVECDEQITVAGLLERLGFPEKGIAVAVDWTVLPRSRWQTTLSDGARLEVVTAVQGG